MKKIVIGALMIGLLAACGGAKDSYSYTDKVALSKKVMKSDSKAIKEYEEIMEKLSEKATKGDQDAMKEAQEWAKAMAEVSGVEIPSVPAN